MKRDFIVVAAAAFVVLGAQASFAASHYQKGDPGCRITPYEAQVNETYVVTAYGIPMDTAINLWVTAPDETTTGSPLGSTPDGTFNLNESSGQSGHWTYTFSGPTKPHTQVFATCSLDVGYP
jgi:hypothetical protein